MSLRSVWNVVGLLQVFVAAAMLTAGLVALGYGDGDARGILLSAAITFVLGAGTYRLTKLPRGRRDLTTREGFAIVTMAWASTAAFGALPFYLTGTVDGPARALFESMSGFTTTGASIFSDIESLPHGILFWRSLTHWLGGMGIIVLVIAVLPYLGVGGMQLFKAEVPGPISDKVEPRVAVTARRLWGIYVVLTAAEILLLWGPGGIPLFDAVCHGLTTLATGGFSTRDASVAAFQSPFVEWVLIFFMLCAGINFVLHYRLVQRRFLDVWRDAELRYFAWMVVGTTALITLFLVRLPPQEPAALRAALFQVVSILTTTGYATADFELWPSVGQLLLLQLMFLGGMAGSTAGGVKSLRVLLGIRALRVAFSRLLHPHAVSTVKYADRAVPADVLGGIWAFFTAYAMLAAGLAAVVAMAGYDPLTAISAALTAVGNVGPGLGAVGPFDNFAHFPGTVKLALCFGMLAGRLEVFTILILLSPGFWRR